MKANIRCGSAASAAWLVGFCLAPMAAAEPLKTGGTGAAVGTIQALAAQYRLLEPSFELLVVPGLGSTGGVKAVAAGALDFGLVGRPLKARERQAGLVAVEYGRTPFVIVTNKEGVEDLSLAQLASLIASSSPTWADGSPVRLVLRPAADSDTDLLGEFSPAVKQALAVAHKRGGMVRAITDQESADESEKLPGSLGTTSLALLRSESRALRVISIGGVVPSLENYRSGAYPHGKIMTLVTQGEPGGATRKFLDFVGSESGRQVLVRLGHLVATPR